MTSVSFPPSRPDKHASPFGPSSSGGFGGHSGAHYGFGLDGAGSGGGKRSKRNLKTQPLEMTTLSTKRKGVNPFDGASSDDNRRNKNAKSNGQSDWKKKNAQAQGARSNGAKKGPKGFGTSQSRGGFGFQSTDKNHVADSTDYETDGEAAGDGTPYSEKILAQLRKDGIAPPKWPSDPGNTKQKAAMAKFREDYKAYRDRARSSLMRAGLIDDPDKPKRLEDAIDFKGICDTMCPDFERITRITEFDVQSAEKDPRTSFAITSKMVKKLARSAAGQEAPLPMDVRSTAALRKTLDYLIDDLLQTDENLPLMHGFLWDRTRAIRRDFIFHSTMTPEEMKDQVYCLETIARFHVTSLHLLSQEGLTPEDFSEQQEIEQLGKSLLSLMFAYDDCKPQGVVCENEAEFRAYHLLFSANKPNILDDVQKEWGDSRFWAESDEIRTAVSLVESLQNTADFHGPLGSAPSMAISGAHRTYFKIVESQQVSYTMACFAEIHLGQLRRSVLSSLKKAYTRPRNGAKDITPTTLNRFLHFDTEVQAIEFVEEHGLIFVDGESPTGESIQYLDTSGRLSWPRIHHSFSQNLVERKRGSRSLPEVIHSTIPDESSRPQQAPFASSSNGPFTSEPGPNLTSKPAGFVTNPAISSNGPSKSPFSSFPAATPTNPAGTSFDKGKDTSSVGSTISATPKNPFSAASPSFGPGAGSQAASTGPPATNPFSNPFTQPTPSGDKASASSPFTSSGQLNGITPSSGPSLPSFASPGFGPSTQQKAQDATQTALPKPESQSSSIFAPSITLTPPTPQFASPGPGSAPKPPSPFDAGAPPAATPAASPFSGLSRGSVNATEKPSVLAKPPASFPSVPDTQAGTTDSAVKPSPSVAQFPLSGLTPTHEPSPKASSSGAIQGQSPLPAFSFQPAESSRPAMPAPTSLPSALPNNTTAAPVKSFDPPAPPPKPPVVEQRPKQDVMGDFSKWFVTADNGLLHEFEKFMVEQIVSEAFAQHHREEEERKRKEEEERDLAEARSFQVYNLSVKYFYRWKEIARKLRLSKIRRQEREEYRKAQQKQREEDAKKRKQAAKVAEARRKALERSGVDPVEELREILQLKKDAEPEVDVQAEAEALFESGVLSGVTDERAAIANVIRVPSIADTLIARPQSSSTSNFSKSVSAAKPCGAKTRALREEFGRGRSNFRRSLPPMSANSSSSRFTPSESPQKRVSKVSDRWRLKAMGLVTMPDGSALPEAIANEMRYNGKRYAGLGSFGLDAPERRSRSVSAELNHAAEARLRFSQSLNGGAPSSTQANGISPLSKRKRTVDDRPTPEADEARVSKRPSSNADVERILREARGTLESLRSSRVDLDEGAEWFREQNEMMQAEELSRASSPWGKGRHQ
ncbi:80 kD MCM3-associated protein (GANP/Nin1/mts3/eIF-3 p25 family protein) [Colletotrichum plurivorum]|uniref:80 kD MCM3-associated protein (GANP/Nin1/mts3/eIF-3 p25 family protein) n=1 Tax=Colletotrichum plurivorum TaxID=2175906 RepID=A0A8H6KRY7_9PEZI|nr:80 kD MCM3-associated protein (GANP/Nin1/mts3/eIF-3 p25 family protein) [Colletotrichum plurivorum]